MNSSRLSLLRSAVRQPVGSERSKSNKNLVACLFNFLQEKQVVKGELSALTYRLQTMQAS